MLNIEKPNKFSLEFASKVQSELLPLMQSQKYFANKMNIIVEDKGEGHYAYKIDHYSNNILFKLLEEYNFSCYVFSEEGGWTKLGNDPKYYIICDPFCNTSLTMRSFREAAASICVTDLNGELISCAIADLQIYRIFYADQTGSYLWEFNGKKRWEKSVIHVSQVREIEEAFLVASLLNRNRRTNLFKSNLFHKVKVLHGVDGAIMIGRLSAGYIDAYIDPFKGQPLYELACCELILRSGGIISDLEGKLFCLPDIISGLLDNPKGRYRIIAASTIELHQNIISALDMDT